MPEFGESAGDFVRNLIHSLQEEAERLPSPKALMDSLREFDPTPEHITEVAGKCADAVTALGEGPRRHGARSSGNWCKRDDPMPDHIDIPDDLSDL